MTKQGDNGGDAEHVFLHMTGKSPSARQDSKEALKYFTHRTFDSTHRTFDPSIIDL